MRYILGIFLFFFGTAIYALNPVTGNADLSANPLSNKIGTSCAVNISNAWLDVALAIDVSNKVLERDLRRLGSILSNVFDPVYIGNFFKQNTRVGLVTYNSYANTPYSFGDIANSSQLNQILHNLTAYYSPNNDGGGSDNALNNVESLFNYRRSYRGKALIMFESSYPSWNSVPDASTLKQMGVTIITIVDGGPNSNLSAGIGALASPGMNFSFLDPYLVQKLQHSLSMANCFCPPGYYQFNVSNQTSGIPTIYADCLYGYSGDTSPNIATQFCKPDILVPVTSIEKLDFIIDNIIVNQMPGAKNFTTGAIKVNGNWNWQNYNTTQYLFGDFPDTSNANGGDIGYFSNTYGFNWQFLGGGAGNADARPFICQTRAYDTDYMGDLA